MHTNFQTLLNANITQLSTLRRASQGLYRAAEIPLLKSHDRWQRLSLRPLG
jgi:hypothetical protein